MQDTKIIVLGVSILLSGLIIGSTPAAAAEIGVDCDYTKDKKTAFCLTDNDGEQKLWRCDKRKNGSWYCSEVPSANRLSSDVKPELKKAAIRAVKRAMKKAQ